MISREISVNIKLYTSNVNSHIKELTSWNQTSNVYFAPGFKSFSTCTYSTVQTVKENAENKRHFQRNETSNCLLFELIRNFEVPSESSYEAYTIFSLAHFEFSESRFEFLLAHFEFSLAHFKLFLSLLFIFKLLLINKKVKLYSTLPRRF